jgi:hypothetical protein
MDIFTEIEKLNLPKGEFLVLGSGILGALGIREVGDVDLLVRTALFEKLQKEGWVYEVIEINGRSRGMLSHNFFQAFKDFWWRGEILDADEGFKRSETIKGINFISLEVLLEAKKEMKRGKDVQDVMLIEKYLQDPRS